MRNKCELCGESLQPNDTAYLIDGMCYCTDCVQAAEFIVEEPEPDEQDVDEIYERAREKKYESIER